MPKIRGFKADLWTDEDFVELTPWARLLWMGMWNYACDNGHLADRSKQIKMRVLPTDDVNCAELLRELEAGGQIVRKDGVITIPNFRRHQKPDRRYFQTCDVLGCLRPDGDSQPETRGANVEARRGHREARSGHSVMVNDGDGEVNRSDGEGSAAGKPRAKQLPKNWKPSTAHAALAAERGVDLAFEADKFRDWCASKGEPRKDWEATFRNWIRNARPTLRPATPVTSGLPLARTIEEPPPGLNAQEYDAWFRAQAAKHKAAGQ